MPASSGCPDPSQLGQLALGRIHGPEADALEEHVAHCPHCGHTLGSLPGVDPLVEAMRGASETEASYPDLVLLLIRQLKRNCAQDTVGFPVPETVTDALTLDFLEPADGEDELGWLGPYRVREMLGAGGMGMVFLAEDPRLKRQVAMKVIKPDLVSREDMRRSGSCAKRRAWPPSSTRTSSPFTRSTSSDGVPYLAMPLLRGESLEDRLRPVDGPLPVAETLRIGRQVAEGLAAAHGRGLVHRDIKPANLFLCASEPARDSGLPGEDSRLRPGPGAGRTNQRPGREPSSARRRSWPPSRRRACRPTPAPTCSALAASSTGWRPGGRRSRARTSSPSSSRSPPSNPLRREKLPPAFRPICRG